MWDCIKCACKAIAHDLRFCPQCFRDKEEATSETAAQMGGSDDYVTVTDAPAEQPADSGDDKSAAASGTKKKA